jgi:hypothetical protein
MKGSGLLILVMIYISACTPASSATPTQGPTAKIRPASTSAPANTPPVTPTITVVLEPFDSVNISASEIEFNVDGDGSDVDSISFWEAPDPAQSLMFVTSKGNSSIEVYQYPYETQRTTISCGEASNGVWVDQERAILYITERGSSNVCAFDLPDLDENDSLSFTTAATSGRSEPNLTMLHLPDGRSRIYVSYDKTVYYHDAETGESSGQFSTNEDLETMYGDDFYQVLYIPDEGDRSGVHIYDPDGNPIGTTFGDDSIFESDAEGIWVYKCLSNGADDTGEGLIVVADQKDDLTDFEVFHRKTKEYLGKINIEGVDNTDGITITQQDSPAYPLGLLAVIDDDKSTVGVGWDTIFAKTGISCGV